MAIYSLEPLTFDQQALIRGSCDIPFVDSSRASFFSGGMNYDDVTCVICRDRDDIHGLLSRCRRLRFLFVVSVGVEKLPFAELKDRQIIVCNVGGINADIMSQYVVAYMLTLSARVLENYLNQMHHVWKKFQTVEDVSGKRALIFGAGRVGVLLAKKLTAFGVVCVGVKRRVCAVRNFDNIISLADVPDYIGTADYVISLLPVTPMTRGYFNAARFSQMKKGAVFINISRAAVVNMNDLCNALTDGVIKSAVVDVFDSEPLQPSDLTWDIPNLIVTPHSSGRLERFMDVAINRFCECYNAYTVGMAVPNAIDLEAGY